MTSDTTTTTTTETTWVGTTGYRISKEGLRVLRRMAGQARTDWKALAARPTLANAWLACYEQAGRDVDAALDLVLLGIADGTMPC